VTAIRVPLVDLAWQHREIEAELREGLDAVMAATAFVLGPQVAEFEAAYAEACGVPQCVGVGNGTDAIELALRALDVGPGDEVVVPAFTFIASALGVVRAGARPVLCEVRSDDLAIDVDAASAAITPRTRAVLGVDLFGRLADGEALERLCAERGIAYVEDAAQSQGAARDGRRSGGFGAVAATSFYPGKNLGAYGDAGAVLTRDAELAGRVRRLRSYGSEQKYHHPEVGFNSRLDTLQAVVLTAKLRRLGAWNALRREAAARYDALLAGRLPELRRPRFEAGPGGDDHVWHLYVVRVAERDAVLDALQKRGIGAGVHYPRPLHLHGALASLGHAEGAFPAAEAAAAEVLSLPLFPGIDEAQQVAVVEALAASLEEVG